MPTPPDQNSTNSLELFQFFSNLVNSVWGWLVPMIGGIFHMGKLHQKINQLEVDRDALRQVPQQIAELSAKVDILLEDRRHH